MFLTLYVVTCSGFHEMQKDLVVGGVFSFVVCARLNCPNVFIFFFPYSPLTFWFLFYYVWLHIRNNGEQSRWQYRRWWGGKTNWGCDKNVSVLDVRSVVRGPRLWSGGLWFVYAKSDQTKLATWCFNCMRCRMVYIDEWVVSIWREDGIHIVRSNYNVLLKKSSIKLFSAQNFQGVKSKRKIQI